MKRVYREFDSLMAAADRVAQNVANGKGTMGKFANDPKVYDELNASVANLNAITTKLQERRGQPRPAAERSGAGQVAECHGRESRQA